MNRLRSGCADIIRRLRRRGAASEFAPSRVCRWALVAVAADLIVLRLVRFNIWVEYGLRALVALAAVGLLLRFGATRADLGFRSAAPGTARWMSRLSLFVVLAYVVLGVIAVLYLRLTKTTVDLSAAGDFHDGPSLLRYIGSALLAAPVVEELIYRSLAVAGLAAWVGPRWAIFLSGPLFYGLHMVYFPGRWWLVHYVFAGWILAWSYLRQRALWVPVVLHSLGNVLMGVDDAVNMAWPTFFKSLLGGG